MAGQGNDSPDKTEAAKPTKRQQRLSKLNNPGADDNEKGEVRGEGDDLEWKNGDGEWGRSEL